MTYVLISTVSPDQLLRVPTFTLQTHKSKNLFSRRCNRSMTVWLHLHPTLLLTCMASSLWKVPIPFTQFNLSKLLPFHKFKCGKNVMTRCPSSCQPTMVMGTSIFIDTPLIAIHGCRAIHTIMGWRLYPPGIKLVF